jgi:hypothetical protein
VNVLDCFLVLHTYFYNTNIPDLFDFITHDKKKSFYFTVTETRTQFWCKFLHSIFLLYFFFCCIFLVETVNSEHCCKFSYIFTQYFEFCTCFCKNYGTICSMSLTTLCCGKQSPWRPSSHLMHTLLALLLTTHTVSFSFLADRFL